MFGPTFDHIETKATPIHKVFNIIALAALIGSVVFLVVFWTKLPDTVPIHFNWKGEADGWGSKYSLVILPIIAAGLFAFLTFFENKPHHYNYVVKITEHNAYRQFQLARTMVNVTKNLSTLLFSFIILSTVFDANETPLAYSSIIIFCLIALLIAVTIIFTIRSIKLK